jgi:carbonic anhydrase
MHRSHRHVGPALLALALSIPAIAHAQHGPTRDQSPIDIVRAHSCVTTAVPRLVATRRHPVTEVWRNTGSPDEEANILVAATPPEGMLELGGKTYHLRQYHFHAPAEHPVNGVLAAMEIHYVHEADDGSLAVIALLVNEGAYNADFNPLLAAMPDTKSLAVTIESSDPLGHTLRPWLEQPRSFRYTGSLTTPPFTTGGQLDRAGAADHVLGRPDDAVQKDFPPRKLAGGAESRRQNCADGCGGLREGLLTDRIEAPGRSR